MAVAVLLAGQSRASGPWVCGVAQQKDTLQARYSPFVLTTREARYVDTITFKEVGGQRLPRNQRLIYDEALAHALVSALNSSLEGRLSVAMHYMPELSEPDAHCACEGRHVYVDLWRAEAPRRWGYSLWSGCEEKSQFAWEELSRPSLAEDVMGEVEPLAQRIAARIAEAERTGCVRYDC